MQQHPPLKNSPRSTKLLWAKRLITLYPASWRERYAEEMLMILKENPPTFSTLVDLLLNLCDAHLHSNIVSESLPNIFKQLYTHTTTILCASLLFFLFEAGSFLFYDIQDFSKTGNIVTSSATFLNMPYLMAYSLALLALLLLFCGVPLLFSTCYQALKNHQRRPLFFGLIGILCILAATPAEIACDTLMSPLYPLIYRFCTALPINIYLRDSLESLLFSGPSLVYGLLTCFGTWTVWVTLRQSIPATRLTKYLLVPAILMPLIMFTNLINPLFLLITSSSSLCPTCIITVPGINRYVFVYTSSSIVQMLVVVLIAWFALLRIYKTRRTDPLKA